MEPCEKKYIGPNEVAQKGAKKKEIALALLEQCKRAGDMRVSDLDEILDLAKYLIVL